MHPRDKILSDCIREIEKGRIAYCTNKDVFLELKDMYKDKLVLIRDLGGIYEIKLEEENLYIKLNEGGK